MDVFSAFTSMVGGVSLIEGEHYAKVGNNTALEAIVGVFFYSESDVWMPLVIFRYDVVVLNETLSIGDKEVEIVAFQHKNYEGLGFRFGFPCQTEKEALLSITTNWEEIQKIFALKDEVDNGV